jgi:hypothetical protein
LVDCIKQDVKFVEEGEEGWGGIVQVLNMGQMGVLRSMKLGSIGFKGKVGRVGFRLKRLVRERRRASLTCLVWATFWGATRWAQVKGGTETAAGAVAA